MLRATASVLAANRNHHPLVDGQGVWGWPNPLHRPNVKVWSRCAAKV